MRDNWQTGEAGKATKEGRLSWSSSQTVKSMDRVRRGPPLKFFVPERLVVKVIWVQGQAAAWTSAAGLAGCAAAGVAVAGPMSSVVEAT